MKSEAIVIVLDKILVSFPSVIAIVEPVAENFARVLVNGEGSPAEQPCSVLASDGDMFLREVKHRREFVIDSFALNGSETNLADFSASAFVLALQVVSLASHGSDDVARGREQAVNEGVLKRGDIPPSGVAVASVLGLSDFALQVEDAALSAPSMTQAVDDDGGVVSLFRLVNALYVPARVVWSVELADVIIAQAGVQIAAAVLGVDESEIPAKPLSDENGAVGFARPRRASDGESELCASAMSFPESHC